MLNATNAATPHVQATPEPGKSPDPCRICGAPGATIVVNQGGFCFRHCPECEFVFLDPMPGAPALAGIYDLEDGYQHSAYHAKRRSRLRRAYFRLPRFLPFIVGKQVLDIGCGGGIHTSVFGHFARLAVGIDASQSAIDYAKSHNSRCEFLRLDCCADTVIGRFDFVYASDLIEHLVDIRQFMLFVAANTAPGAYVYVATPDFASPRRPADVAKWDVLTPPHHVQFFTEGNLTKLFGQHGFARSRRYRSTKVGLNMLFQRRDG